MYEPGQFETIKFAHRRPQYHRALDDILKLGYEPKELIHEFPAFVGQMTLWRALSLYELYKRTIGIAGHIAEVGVYKGFGSLLFGKLVELFEPESLTLVHGFDWFAGTSVSDEDRLLVSGTYREDEARLRALVALQRLDHVVKIHRLDVSTEIESFFADHPHMRFKLVFLDAGTYAVMSKAIPAFWSRIIPGGLLVLDQFNNEVAPGETRAVSEFLAGYKIETLPNSWMPNAFVQKPWINAADR